MHSCYTYNGVNTHHAPAFNFVFALLCNLFIITAVAVYACTELSRIHNVVYGSNHELWKIQIK